MQEYLVCCSGSAGSAGCWLGLLFRGSPLLLWQSSSPGLVMLVFSSVMKQSGNGSVPFPWEEAVEVGDPAACPRERDEEAGHVSRRSFSTSGKGLTVAKRRWYSPQPEPWLQDVFMLSRSEQLNSEKWLEWESATEGRLPLSDGESNSDELVLRCSNSWASISSRVSLIFLLPPPFLRSLPLPFLPPELEEEEHDASLTHLAVLPLPSEELQPAAGLVQPQRPTLLPSSTLLPPLWCRRFTGLDSISTWTSKLFPSLEQGTRGNGDSRKHTVVF